MNEPDNVKGFNFIVLSVLSALYSKFPEPMDLKSLRFLISTIIEHGTEADEVRYAKLFPHAVRWLSQEGFIRYGSENHDEFYRVTLTLRGITVLGRMPRSLIGPKKTLWQRSQEVVKKGMADSAADARRVLVAELLKGMSSLFASQ